MTARITHRGPDDVGERQWPTAGLGFRRLALVDLRGGHQPATDERGRFWSVFNGEIYNHVELRRELRARGHELYGTGDADLIPHLYEEWGAEFVHRVRGMFAIAVHDTETGELFLARDAFGIKPMYWVQRGDLIAFASEVAALRAVDLVPTEPDPTSVWHYLSYGYVPEPLTMWAGIHMLPAGHFLHYRNGQASVHRWWEPDFRPDESLAGSDVAAEILSRLEGSVAAHLAADVPVGAYLSSGVDSNLLVALACKFQEVRTFSIGFHDTEEGRGELSAASAQARALGTIHHEQVVSADDYWQALPRVVASQEVPLADPSAPALWFLAQAAGAQVKAVLSGEGADELFGGYPVYREPRSLRAVTGLPRAAREQLSRLAPRLPAGRPGRGFLERGTTPLERRFLGNAPVFSAEAKSALWAADPQPAPSSDLVQPFYAGTDYLDDVARMQVVSCHTWLPNSILLKADKMAMAHSLEVRVPYLDREVFAIASRLPERLRVNRSETKVALRAAARLVLPTDVAQRPKLGFPIPFRAWLKGPIAADVRELLLGSADPLLEPAGLLALIDHTPGAAQQRRLWSVMTYLLWRRAQVDSTPSPVASPGRGRVAPERAPEPTV